MGTDRRTEYRKVSREGVFSYLSRQMISEWQGWGNEAQIASAMGIWSNTRTGPQNPEEWQWVTREAEGRSSQKRVYAEDKVGDWAQTDWDHCWPWWRVEISRFFSFCFGWKWAGRWRSVSLPQELWFRREEEIGWECWAYSDVLYITTYSPEAKVAFSFLGFGDLQRANISTTTDLKLSVCCQLS